MIKKLADKLINNKLFLFIIPNLVYGWVLLFLYNNNFGYYMTRTEVLVYEILIIGTVLFLIQIFFNLFLKITLKDIHKIFCVAVICSCSYFLKFDLLTFLIWILFLLVLMIIFKKCSLIKLGEFVWCISMIIIILFTNELFISVYNVFYSLMMSKNYDYEIKFNVDSSTNSPNIYWIHCDGMMNFSVMEKYFNYDNVDLKTYFNNDGFLYNEDTLLVAGHRTQSSLVAMFNPYYYDNFFGDYLNELENSFLEGNEADFIVNYYELEEKRLYNELFAALKEKDYSIVAIADFNQYTGLYTDYFYDFYNEYKVGAKAHEFRYIDMSKQTEFQLLSYIRFNHSKSLLNSVFFYPLLRDVNYLEYDVLNYQNNDIEDYHYTNDSQYWIGKAILAGINDIQNIENNKFVFIDFKLNHFPMSFDADGNYILEENRENPDYYVGNYIYSTKLFIEMLDYIKAKDNNAIIFVQGDHGIHIFGDAVLREYFNISQRELQNIRNSVINAHYIPDEYKNGDEVYLNNPLNISRYIVNNFVGDNYEYIK